MTTTPTDLWTPPPVPSLPVRGRSERLPVRRLFFVGRKGTVLARGEIVLPIGAAA